MPSSPSHESHSRSSRSVDRELKRRKRYSLRIEVLDDDDDDEDDEVSDRRRKGADHPSRSTKGTPTSRSGADGRREHPQETSRKSRQASVRSITAVVGSNNPSSTSVQPPPSERDRRDSSKQRGPRPSWQGSEDYVTAAELSEAFNQRMSMRDRDEAELPRNFARQSSIRDQDDTGERSSSSSHRRKKPSYKHAYTQTDLKGLDAYSIYGPFYPPPALGIPFVRSPGPGEQFNAEMAAYNNGFLLGRQLASSHMPQPQHYNPHVPPPAPPPSVSSLSQHTDIQPPQPSPVQQPPSRRASSSPRSPPTHDRDRRQSSSSRQNRKASEEQQQPQSWRASLQNWVTRARCEPSTPPRSGSHSSGRSHRR
ncbi:hypothetical protein F5Y06DRAFT_305396 [Hypoxylon sp. FL0890]|nr:hypothetical protein F5Y06DRAFT_305396 [Hypoxylon sp. FL0890]